MAKKPDISIIGPGVVGTALGRLACSAGYRVAAVGGGSQPARAQALAEAVGGAKVSSPPEAASAGQLVLLTVKDAAIQPVCEQLARAGGLGHHPVVAHCSGALNCEVLSAARQMGCSVGSMHPLQTFPNVEAAISALPGAYFFIEGDRSAVVVLEQLTRCIGAHPVRIDPSVKPLYHAAAVMSANYITTLLDAAMQLYQTIGVDRTEARKAVAPLVRATVENVLKKGTGEALTGPISRGDVETVRRHLEAMGQVDEATRDLYRILGRRTVEIARRKGSIDSRTQKALLRLLSEGE